MEPMDRKRFGDCLKACSELYGKPLSVPVIELWWQALARYDIDAVESAFRRHLVSPDAGQYMPKPSDIVRLIDGTSVDASQVAWAAVERAVRLVGPYASVTFDDPVTMRVLADMGGWIALNLKGGPEWAFVANEFRTRYQGFRSRGEAPAYPPRLPGIAEADNARRGLAHAEHVLIGDTATAQRVLAGGTDRPAVDVARLAVDQAAPRLVLVKSEKEANG
jgi:hypothetical protein